MTRADQLTDPLAYHAEGPCWSDVWGGLRWVDMLAGDLLTLRADGSVDRLHVGEVAAFVRPRTHGGYVVGTGRGIALADDPDEQPTARLELWADRTVRMNEGGCDAVGNLYAGSMADDQTPGAATLYRVTPSGEISVALPDVTVSNGIAVSPDGTRAYYNDTATGRTDVLTVDESGLSERRPFVDHGTGRPDGLCVDSAGNVWVALNGSGTVRCFAPDGGVVGEVTVPVRLTTACTLGGADGRDLFITTSREDLDDPEPEAGAVFRARVDVPGLATLPYGG